METRTVRTSVELTVEPQRAIQAFVDRTDLAGWWRVSRALVEPHPGGVWSVAWDLYGEQQTNHSWFGVVREIAPDRLLISPLVQNEPDRPLFGPLELEVLAEPLDEGCRLTILHHGYQSGEHWDWLHEAVVQGWRHEAASIKSWLERR